MRATQQLFALILIACPLGAGAQGASQLGEWLMSVQGYAAQARFEALLPQAEDPVTYDVRLQSTAAPDDSLAPCSYVLSWQANTPSGPMEGFSAYFDGNHYRFRNSRLQEYHFDDNAMPFLPSGPGSESMGVQCTAQFADLLPQMLGKRLAAMDADPAYVIEYHADTLVSGCRRIVVDGVKRVDGYDASQFAYVFDRDTRLPVSADITTGLGSLSEQIITVHYLPPDDDALVQMSEQGLMEAWPDAFERFRQSTYRAESLVGEQLPDFSCRISGSEERYTHQRGEALGEGLLIVAIDPDVGSAQATVDAVRQAVDATPAPLHVLWAASSDASGLIDRREGETLLFSTGQLVRSTGITLYPTIILCRPDGTVADVISGYSPTLRETLMQKAALAMQPPLNDCTTH